MQQYGNSNRDGILRNRNMANLPIYSNIETMKRKLEMFSSEYPQILVFSPPTKKVSMKTRTLSLAWTMSWYVPIGRFPPSGSWSNRNTPSLSVHRRAKLSCRPCNRTKSTSGSSSGVARLPLKVMRVLIS